MNMRVKRGMNGYKPASAVQEARSRQPRDEEGVHASGLDPAPFTHAQLLSAPLEELMAEARHVRDSAHGNDVTFSPKVRRMRRDEGMCRAAASYSAGAHLRS